jgi:hypothetical protein
MQCYGPEEMVVVLGYLIDGMHPHDAFNAVQPTED